MYPEGCKEDTTRAVMRIRSSTTTLKYTYAYDWNGMNSYFVENLEAGTYTMTVEPRWDSGVDVPDLTVRVISNQNVHLTLQNGTAGQTNKMLIQDLGVLQSMIGNPFRDLDSDNATVAEQIANGTYQGDSTVNMTDGTQVSLNGDEATEGSSVTVSEDNNVLTISIDLDNLDSLPATVNFA